jgi:hypothetical protein
VSSDLRGLPGKGPPGAGVRVYVAKPLATIIFGPVTLAIKWAMFTWAFF